MALETATFIHQLVATNPVGATDTKAQGDDHLRLTKSTLQNTFPNITGAMTATHTALNAVAQGDFDDGSAATPGISFTLDQNTGIYRAGADDMRLVAGGTVNTIITATSLNPKLPIYAQVGAAATPAFTFETDTDSGMYHGPGTGDIRFASDGSLILQLSTAGVKPGRVVLPIVDGAVGAPLYSFDNDPDTGIYLAGANSIGFATAGVLRGAFTSTELFVRYNIQSANGAVATPAFSFESDGDCGMYRIGANNIGLAVNATKIVDIGTAGVAVTGTLSSTGTLTGTAGVFDGTVAAGPYPVIDVPRRTSGFARGQCTAISAGATINTSDLAAGTTFSIYNDSAANITITQGAGVTLRQNGTTNTGNRTLLLRGIATVWCNSGTEAVISGAVS